MVLTKVFLRFLEEECSSLSLDDPDDRMELARRLANWVIARLTPLTMLESNGP